MDRAHGIRHRSDGPVMRGRPALRQRRNVAACALCTAHPRGTRGAVLDGYVETRRATRHGAAVERARVVVVAVSRVLAERPRRSSDRLHALACGIGRCATTAEADADAGAARAPVWSIDGKASPIGPAWGDVAALGLEVDRERTGARRRQGRVGVAMLRSTRSVGRRAAVLVDHRDTWAASEQGSRAQRQQHKRSHDPLLLLPPAVRRKPLTMRTLTR